MKQNTFCLICLAACLKSKVFWCCHFLYSLYYTEQPTIFYYFHNKMFCFSPKPISISFITGGKELVGTKRFGTNWLQPGFVHYINSVTPKSLVQLLVEMHNQWVRKVLPVLFNRSLISVGGISSTQTHTPIPTNPSAHLRIEMENISSL